MSKKVTATSTMGKPSSIGRYRVDRLSFSQLTTLEDYCNDDLKELGYKPVSISEIYEGSPTKHFTRYTVLSKKMNFFQRIGLWN